MLSPCSYADGEECTLSVQMALLAVDAEEAIEENLSGPLGPISETLEHIAVSVGDMGFPLVICSRPHPEGQGCAVPKNR